jgi:hypothetical protein
VEAKETITDKYTKDIVQVQVQVQVELARGDGRYQQLLEDREIQYFEDIFLTFCCYPQS